MQSSPRQGLVPSVTYGEMSSRPKFSIRPTREGEGAAQRAGPSRSAQIACAPDAYRSPASAVVAPGALVCVFVCDVLRVPGAANSLTTPTSNLKQYSTDLSLGMPWSPSLARLSSRRPGWTGLLYCTTSKMVQQDISGRESVVPLILGDPALLARC